MKLNRLFYAIGIGCTLCACSSNDDLAPEQKGEIGANANYLAISIVTAGEDGTRADDPYAKENIYDNGIASEKAVNKVRLYFFDVDGNKVFSKDFGTDDMTVTDTSNPYNPATTSLTTIEVELTANRDYHSVVAILNPPADAPTFSKLSELRNHTADYGDWAQNGTFTMSNSVYYDTESYEDPITQNMSPVVAVPIYTSNIYTHTEIDKITDETARATALRNLQNQKAINIYVERVCAKVSVTNKPMFTAHFVDKKGTTKKIKIIGEDGKEKEIEVSVKFRGMDLTVLPKDARVIKKLPGYPEENTPYYFCKHVPAFKWNNPLNFRTHWEDAGSQVKTNYTRPSWKDLADNADKLADTDPITTYINPNTQDATNHEKDDADFTTKLLVCAQLYFEDENGVEQELDLVRYSGGFWFPSRLIQAAATRVVENLQTLDLTKVTVDGQTLTEDEQTKAQNAIKKLKEDNSLTKIETGEEKAAIYLQKLSGTTHDYLAELTLKDKDVINKLLGLEATDASTVKVSSAIRTNMTATLKDMTNREIQYWKDGMTYFYVPIRHVGFPGLEGDISIVENGTTTTSTNYLNGVVRNHSYVINIEKIYGVGTPVINPTDPIDPERPDDAPASYITAKIHVLKWKMVNSNLTLH